MRIYVGSMFVDLRLYHDAAVETLSSLGLDVTGPEFWTSGSAVPVERCLDALRGTDALVAMIGHRYGFVADALGKSMAQIEFEEAGKLGLPIFAFYLADDVPLRFSDIEGDATLRSRLAAFRSDVQQWPDAAAVRTVPELQSRLAIRIAQWLQLTTVAGTVQKADDGEVERQAALIRELREEADQTVPAQPIWQGRNFDIDASSCVVLLPLKQPFIGLFRDVITPAAAACGLTATHAAEIFDNRPVVDSIWQLICAARIVIADVTYKNVNVFYELGICHTLGKPCIVATQRDGDVPFDIRHLRYLHYAVANPKKYEDDLVRWITNTLTQTSL